MSLQWYPVIDQLLCVKCGTCSNFCPHGVYNKSESPVPVVVYPQGCINRCHRCADKCPVHAISYFGDKRHSAN